MIEKQRESGSALLIIIGVIAALAILAATMVMLLGNVQANTSRDRQQKTSFSVSEAAMDAAIAQLSDKWATTATTFNSSTYLQSYLNGLTAAGYATPTVTVHFYDNSGTGGAVGTDTYDKNGDNRVWVEATATTGKRTTRLRVLTERVMVNLGLLDNIAVWTPGMFDSQSAASSVTYEVLGPGATQAIIEYNFLAPGSKALDGTVKAVTPATSADLVISPELLSYFRAEALRVNKVGEGKFYTDVSQVGNAAANWEGLIYVDSNAASGSRQIASQQSVTWNWNNTTLNGDGVGSAKKPGVLIVDAQTLKLQGNGSGFDFYGLVYCTGGIEIQGGIRIHGMVLAGGVGVPSGTDAIKLGGSQNVIYNDNVRANLNRQYSISVHMIANTWRELGTAD
jgi:Tfp pilus assembly protein PilX